MAFFKLWKYLREKEATPETKKQPKLSPAQLSRLFSDSKVREVLKDEDIVPLLPPVGRELFRRLTLRSLQDIEQQLGTNEEEQQRMKNHHAADRQPSKPNARLEDGEALPFFYGDPPKELLYTPLEELDPFYQSQKTFLVVSRGNVLHRFNADPSCFLLSPFNRLRTVSIKILLNTWFQWFILMTLLINCVIMTIENTMLTKILECVFTSIYTFEVVLKVFSCGFCLGRFTFIRDPWNWLDLLIIITAYPAHFVDLGKFSVLVTIPRVLKVFAVSSGLRKRVEALIQSWRSFTDILVMTVFWLSILAAVATQFFTGLLRTKCVSWPPHLTSDNVTSGCDNDLIESCQANLTSDSGFDYSAYIRDPGNYYHRPGQLDPLLCGNGSGASVCPQGSICLRAGKPPNYGYTSYDSFVWSLLSMFRLLTQDNWENLLQQTLQTGGPQALVFLLLFIPLCFLLLSLLLAAVVMVAVDHEKIKAAKRTQRDGEYRRIVEVLKRLEEEEKEASIRGTAAAQQDHEENGVTVTAADKDHLHQSRWQRFRLWLRPLVLSPRFDLLIILTLIINTIVMATDHYPMSLAHEEMLSLSQLIFTGIFAVEMLLRLLALGIRGYFQVSWHIFDSILVVFSLVEISLHFFEGLGVLRCLYLLRILRLARWWPSLHVFLRIIWFSTQSRTLRVLLVLVFLWVVAGMQLFRTDYEANVCAISDDCRLPRWHMHDLFHTFIVVFRVLCGAWIETMWDCMEVSEPGICAVYFITFVVIGKLLVVILFLDLLFHSAICSEWANLEETSVKQTGNWTCWWWTGQRKHVESEHQVSQDQKEFISLTAVTDESDLETDDKTEAKADQENQDAMTPADCCCKCCYHSICLRGRSPAQDSGGVWTKSRTICLLIVRNRFFEGFVVFVILLSSILLVFEDIYLLQRPVLLQVLDWADLVFTLIFLLEMILKWMAFGLKQYFSSFSCWLDFLILDASLVALILHSVGMACRPLRALRTLRILSRFQGLRVLLKAFPVTLPHLLQALLVVLTVWLLFGTLGVSLFGGKFYFCFNETSEELFSMDVVNNMSDCLELTLGTVEVRWKNTNFHFDHVGMSFLSLQLMATSAGWVGLTSAATDARRVHDQPVYENNVYMMLYFVCFMVFGCFFCFHFLARVLLKEIQRYEHQMRKHLFMTEHQQIYSRGFKERFTSKPANSFPPPQNRCQALLFALVTSPRFEIFMVLMACLNVFALGMDAFENSWETSLILSYVHFGLVIVFLLECVLKIVALRRFYFKSALNVIDLIVLITCCVELLVADLFASYFSVAVVVVFRLARLGRVLRFCRCARGINTLLLGFLMSLPALVNIGILLFITVFTFSVIGMFNFGYVSETAGINDVVNFKTFWNSLLTMMTVTTTSSWAWLLIPLMATPPDCDPHRENPGSSVPGNCGSPAASVIFFTSYIVLFLLLVVHLFIAVILEVFNAREPASSKCETPDVLTDQHLQMFYETWKKFDPEASRVIRYSELSEFCDALQAPLRIAKPNAIKLIHLDLPLLAGDRVYCLDVLQTLSAEVFGDPGSSENVRSRLEEKFPVDNAPETSYEPISSTLQRKHEDVAAEVIQRAFKKHHLKFHTEGASAPIKESPGSVGGASATIGEKPGSVGGASEIEP